MDNNFVGGDVIPNYLESFWLSFCEWVLSFTMPAFFFVFYIRQGIDWLHVYIQLLAIRVYRSISLIVLKFFTLLLRWKIFSTRGHKPSLFRFRFLDLGLVLPQEDGSSNDIGFLTSQWRWNRIGATIVWSTGAQETVRAASQGFRKWRFRWGIQGSTDEDARWCYPADSPEAGKGNLFSCQYVIVRRHHLHFTFSFFVFSASADQQ